MGGRIVLVDNALALPHAPAADQVRLVNTVPSAIAALLKSGGIPAGIRTVNLAGEPLRAELVDALYARGGIDRVYDLYGPSEDTTYSTWTLRAAGGPATIGRPISNTRAYVLDAALRPAPVGVPGELYLAGLGLARGYLGRPALTAERWVPDAFSADGGRLYRTGDRVRWRTDGTLEYLGRLDSQVKVRGFRIELGEIETALRKVEGVSDCVVVAREVAPGEKRLAAYVVGRVDADALRDRLRRTLPEHMVPGALVAMDALPLTPNGKVDRKALPAPEYGAAAARRVAPRTPTEEVLAGIWAEILRVERVGATDGFFELGGHSLLATRVISRVRAVFGVEVSVRALFEGPTVAELAARVEELRRADRPQLPPVVPVGRTGALPPSFAQERLWFLHRMEPDSAVYNIPAAVRLRGALDAAALERALGEVVRRHESLRTIFAERGGAPVQVVAPFAGFALPVEDLSSAGDAEHEAEVRRRAAEDAARPFDLAAGPLFRAGLLRLADDEHVLLLCMHHVVSDGWSLGVLFRELSELYAAFAGGAESPLAELPVQPADFAAWQREQLRGEALERQLAYWRERLADAPALLELPTDRPRPAAQSDRGAREPVRLPGALVERLHAVARAEGATLYMTLLAAWQVLLSKYAGTDDVVVGSPIAGRTRGETEGLIGFFVNTLVLRVDLSGDPSFRDVLRRVREATLGAYEHQDVPFERLVEELQPERSLSHSPLFQVLFALQNTGDEAARLGAVEMEGLETGDAAAKFDLSLVLGEEDGGVSGTASYRAELWEPATVRRMLGHFRAVLEALAADPDRRLSAVELPAGDERRLLEAWSRSGDAPAPADRCVHELFAEQAERTPDALALVAGAETLTYSQLHARSDALARVLAARGVGPDARVGICVERGPGLVVGLLGILKAGGAYVPLDPQYPAERLAFMLADAGARVLLTEDALRGRFPAFAGEVVALDTPHPPAPSPTRGEGEHDGAEDGAAVALHAARAPDEPCTLSSDHLAYVIYTSGSTGLPKGTEVPHRAIPGFFRGVRYARFDGTTVLLQHSSVSWDALTLELWPALLSGGTCVLYPGHASEPGELGEQVRRHGVNTLWLTAAYFNLVVDTCPEILAGVAQVMTGGEAVSAPHARRALELYPELRLVNGYGPSECTVFATCHPVPAGFAGASLPVGRPVGDRRVHLLDRHLGAVPLGAAGEVCIGGPAVARGYLGRPALTAERFVPDPFGEPGARLYRSGDRARWGADGTLEFVGRVDFQVKIRGFRVEPGEVEAALAAHPAVREAAVVVHEPAPGDRRLVGYVTAADGANADPAELRAWLGGRMPEYMVPAAVAVLETLPLTPHGKLDRRALPAPEYAAAGERYVAPRTPAEEVVAGIWAEVLGVERVGTADGFFDLGGHSLLATRVVSRVREALGVELPLRALFEAPTVAELAGRVEALRRAGRPQLPPVAPVGRADALPLSFAQERLWFLDRLQPAGAAYNIPVALRLSGPLDEPALARALGEIVRRHEALRTVFADREGAPVQRVAPFAGLALPVEDLSAAGDAERDAAAARRAAEEAARPFDLAAGPLFRPTLLRLAAEEHVLLLCMHHIVGDAWSVGVLLRELSALYAAFREGRESPLPELPVQYADYAAWERRHLRPETLEPQLAWWRGRLAGAPALLELPTDRPRPPVQTHRGAHEPVALPAGLVERLRALGRAEGATLYMVLLGAFQVLLSKYAGTDDVVVGSPVAGRTRRETEGLIGFFVNTLVLRTDLSGDPGFREVLGRVRETTLGAYEHQDVPFARLVEELQPERSFSHSPLFQVSFSLDNASGDAEALAGLRVEGVGAEMATAKFDLTLAFGEHAAGLTGAVAYNTDLFERATVVRMLGHLERVLEQVAADPGVRLSGLELPGEGEPLDAAADCDETCADFPTRICIHELFEAQAERTPDAPAVRFLDQVLTFAELDRRANRLANHLLRRGVRPETRVALCLERGPELVVALLAVLKAGGAYVPLDPTHPAERIALVARDADAPLLLTVDRLAPDLGDAPVSVVRLDGDADAIAMESAERPASTATPESLAYLIYTSGSTGTPKGVMVEHRELVAYVLGVRERLELDEARTFALVSTPAADLGHTVLFPPLVSGGCLLPVPHEIAADGAALAEYFRANPADCLKIVPSHLAALLAAPGGEGCLPRRRLVLGGEASRADWVEEIQRLAPGCEVANHYGPTETTVGALAFRVRPGADLRGGSGSVPLGRPLPGARAYVLDAWGRPLPAGVPGELHVGGAGVARGYQGRPGQTAETFVPDPFAGEPGARMYRTGDRVKRRADGELEFLGRVDDQVKVRGFRVEPGEVAGALLREPGVREAVVMAREDGPGGVRLVAYLVGEVDVAALRESLRRALPDYMVPAAFVVLDRLPLTPNGKLDRRALPAPDSRPDAEAYVEPRTGTERALAALWAAVLQVETVGATDAFLALGGHSLLAIRLQAGIRRELGCELGLRALLEARTLADMAAAVDAARAAGRPATETPILRRRRPGAPLA
ncbi:MAG TPA: amino acid adenylation domain-containing protein [Longimicrobiaceae bacterium]